MNSGNFTRGEAGKGLDEAKTPGTNENNNCIPHDAADISIDATIDRVPEQDLREKQVQQPKEDDHDDHDDANNMQRGEEDGEEEVSTLKKAIVCVVAGIFASQLQFAFVFGQDLVDRAKLNDEGPGETPSSVSAAVIWLFAIPVGAPISIIYGLCSSPSHVPVSAMWRCPVHRHFAILFTTAVPFVAHIHLYGLATTFLPASFGAAIAWPILMMTTVAVGMFWSVGLKEWEDASPLARRQLCTGLAIVTLGIVIIMCSTALPSSS